MVAVVDAGYHHGALRQTLLEDGRRLLAESGVEAVTLRELARRAGVSHGAPRRHFADRDALLAAIAAGGFDELTAMLQASANAREPAEQLAAYAHAFVRFAIENRPLLTLMFSLKAERAPVALVDAAQRFFALGGELTGQQGDRVGTSAYLIAATLEGIGALVATGRLPNDRVEDVIEAAVAALTPLVVAGGDEVPAEAS